VRIIASGCGARGGGGGRRWDGMCDA
jgi:hypothetical protein